MLTVAENRNSSDQQVFFMYSSYIKCIFVMYQLSLWEDFTARSFYSSFFMSELLNHSIKRVSYVKCHQSDSVAKIVLLDKKGYNISPEYFQCSRNAS